MTLNEINITPLLDLAFVLLIIFIITRPMIEQSIQLDLPSGGAATERIEKEDIARVEVTVGGEFVLDGRQMSVDQVERTLLNMHTANPDLVVHIAGDKLTHWQNGVRLIDICKKNNITRFDIKTTDQ